MIAQILSSIGDGFHTVYEWMENSPISAGIDAIGTCFAALPAPITALAAIITSVLVVRILMKLL